MHTLTRNHGMRQYTAEEFEKNVKFNTYEQKNLQLLINERRSRK